MFVIGIDPGSKGAVAILDTSTASLVDVFDLPTRKMGKGGNASSVKVDFTELTARIKPYAAGIAAVEVAIVKPPMGLTAARSIGMNYATILDVLEHLQIGVIEMAPSSWKKKLGLTSDKGESDSLALSLFPRSREKFTRHDRSEAALIARAGSLELAGS